jgi:hypothetical protein
VLEALSLHGDHLAAAETLMARHRRSQNKILRAVNGRVIAEVVRMIHMVVVITIIISIIYCFLILLRVGSIGIIVTARPEILILREVVVIVVVVVVAFGFAVLDGRGGDGDLARVRQGTEHLIGCVGPGREALL